MTNWYAVFYWLTVGDGVKEFFDTCSNWFTFFSILFFILYVVSRIVFVSLKEENDTEENKDLAQIWGKVIRLSNTTFYVSLVICLITWTGYVLTPTKKDALLIIAGGAVGNFLTTDTSAKKLPADLAKFLHLTLKKQVTDLSDDARKELGILTEDDKMKEAVKGMTGPEAIEYYEKLKKDKNAKDEESGN